MTSISPSEVQTLTAALNDPARKDRWISHMNTQFNAQNVLGQGGFGTVYRVDVTSLLRVGANPSVFVACKKLNINNVSQRQRNEFQTEVQLMQRVSHPNILRTFGSSSSSAGSIIVMELMSGGSVHEALSASPIFCQRIQWIRRLLAGLQALHADRIAHRDLKPLNMLLSVDQQETKICDFGLAKLREETMSMSTRSHSRIACGTTRYMAPELLNARVRRPNLFAADMYAIGGCIEHILIGEMPHAHLREDALLEVLRRTAPQDLVAAELPDDCPEKECWAGLIALCRAVDPARRPDASAALASVDALIRGFVPADLLEAASQALRSVTSVRSHFPSAASTRPLASERDLTAVRELESRIRNLQLESERADRARREENSRLATELQRANDDRAQEAAARREQDDRIRREETERREADERWQVVAERRAWLAEQERAQEEALRRESERQEAAQQYQRQRWMAQMAANEEAEREEQERAQLHLVDVPVTAIVSVWTSC